MRRTVVLAAVLVTAGLVVAPSASADPTPEPLCTWENLPTPPGVTGTRFVVGSGQGTYAGDAVGSTGRGAVLWHDGAVRWLGTPGGDVRVHDVNRSGVVVAQAGDLPVVHRADGWHALATPAGWAANRTALRVGVAGDVVGSDGARWLRWPAEDPGRFEEVAPPLPDSDLTDYADDGTLVGVGHPDFLHSKGFVRLPGGGWDALPTGTFSGRVGTKTLRGRLLLGYVGLVEVAWDPAGGYLAWGTIGVEIEDHNADETWVGVDRETGEVVVLPYGYGGVRSLDRTDVYNLAIDDDGTVLGTDARSGGPLRCR
ncbi:hypothetical protein [Actinosynnema sp. NPDC020468]|uniref:hypothetical protein n=1 Tax=Actinosynnema sp. NPDC020468 TaxID=3154488 RepID=UPI0033F6817A